MNRKLKLIAAVLFCLTLLLPMASAQSGRKQKKAEPQPPVQGVNQPEARTQPEPEVEPEADKQKDKASERSLLVMSALPDIGLSSWYVDTARLACVREIQRLARGLVVREAANQHRSDAIKAAKDDDKTHVVWLELVADGMNSTMGGLDLRYTIMEPKTGKVVGSGAGYPRQPNSGNPVPPMGASREQMLLDWAGRDVAEQVVNRLKLRSGY
jgi:hypothetical protein